MQRVPWGRVGVACASQLTARRGPVLQCGRAGREGRLSVQPAEGVQRPERLGPNRAVSAPAHLCLHQEPRRILPTLH